MIEWEHLALFCQGDDDFFTEPEQLDDESSRLDTARRDAPMGWTRSERQLWVQLRPNGQQLPDTGWKIHVSAAATEAERTCEIVWDYCIGRGLTFKFLRSNQAVQLMNGKYADRSGSGKLLTLYPRDEAELTDAIRTLSVRLAGVRGPFILSDLRIGDGPLFVRYGAFTEMRCVGSDGEPTLARRAPDGTLVPDEREPAFSLPDGVSIPAVLRPHLDALTAEDATEFPYSIQMALHYSNSGGVYLAHDANGQKVVLVEARAHAGLDRNVRDAVTRLGVQRDMLGRLAGLDCVPRMLDYFIAWEHHFLVEEYIEGASLFDEMVDRYPYAQVASGPSDEDKRAYVAWADDVMAKLERAVTQLNTRGVRFGDLHPSNVLLRPNGEVVLVDFEYCRDLDDRLVRDGGAPGFHAAPGLTGAAADRYQLECIRIWLYLPMNLRPEHTPAQFRRAVAAALDLFPAGPEFNRKTAEGLGLAEARHQAADVADRLLGPAPSWKQVRDSMIAGVYASARRSEKWALFPGSPPQFSGMSFSLGYGTAGVLHALRQVEAEVPELYVDRMLAEIGRERNARPGLYDGLHGAAFVQERLGDLDGARRTIELARAAESRVTTAGLHSGLAGIGLNLLHFAQLTGDDELYDGAIAAADQLGRIALTGTDTATVQAPQGAGLLRGMSGLALFLVHMYESTGESQYLEQARAALYRDLANGEFLGGGTFHLVNWGTRRRNIMYVDGGSAGLAVVADRYLRHTDDRKLVAAVTGVRMGCRAAFVRQPGLFSGRAGFVGTLAQLDNPEDLAVLAEHFSRFAVHAQPYKGHLAFPSTKLLRLAMDLASGSAGILLALNSAFGNGAPFLPYLDSRRSHVELTMTGGE